jgi:hypothetical protein
VITLHCVCPVMNTLIVIVRLTHLYLQAGLFVRHMEQGVPDPPRAGTSSDVHEHLQRVSRTTHADIQAYSIEFAIRYALHSSTSRILIAP